MASTSGARREGGIIAVKIRKDAVRCVVALAGVVMCLTTSPASAQRVPDAGSLLRDFGGKERQRHAPVLPPAPEEPPAPTPEKTGAKLLVKDFRIRATQFSETTLKALLQDYVGRELTMGDLREAALRITTFYRDHDLLARAYIPRQTIRNGVVEIVVLEGRLGGVNVDPAGRTRLDPSVAAEIVEHRLTPGEILHTGQLQEGVAILNEIPGVEAKATLRPGAAQGETAVDLVLEDTPLVSGEIQSDNENPRFVSEHRVIGALALNNPFGRGEQLSTVALWSRGSQYARISTLMPVGASGLTAGIHAAYLDYRLRGPFRALDLRGHAYTVGTVATYPIRRRPTFALTGLASFEHRRLVDKALGENISSREINVGHLGFDTTLLDRWLGGGITNVGATVVIGNLDRSANSDDLMIDALTARSDGNYGKLTVSVVRRQRVAKDTELFVAGDVQLATKNLDSTEKFSLGGPEGIRAYPVNEGNGDHGFLATIEVRHWLRSGLRVFGFYDVGGVVQHYRTWPGWEPVAGQSNTYVLQGIGLGMGWSPIPELQLRAMYAHALGPNPGRDAQGNNADGRDSDGQLWLQASIIF